MTEALDITVENKFRKEKRDINVYHHSSRSAHIISFNSSITHPLRTADEDDYLLISVVRGPGNLWKYCLINLPSWTDFEFDSEGKVTLIHSSDRTLLKIPPGRPIWQLKITRPTETRDKLFKETVIIGDSNP